MAKHTAADLAQMQSLPLEIKIRMTKRRIEEWYDHWDGMVYVSFSGGKDSTVLKHIVDSMYDDVPAIFVNTGLEYPEIQKFAISQKNVEVIRPKMMFNEVLSHYGYPVISKEVSKKIKDGKLAVQKGNTDSYALKQLNGTYNNTDGISRSKYNITKWKFLLDTDFKISYECCEVMKKRPAHKYEKLSGRKPFLGTMADESRLRFQRWLDNGCNAFDKKSPASAPLSFWTDQDILKYIKLYNVPYSSVYGDIIEQDCKLVTTGCDRTGCIFCAFGAHLESEPNRFQRLKETHPKQYEYCIRGGGYDSDGLWKPTKEGLGLGHVLDEINVKY